MKTITILGVFVIIFIFILGLPKGGDGSGYESAPMVPKTTKADMWEHCLKLPILAHLPLSEKNDMCIEIVKEMVAKAER